MKTETGDYNSILKCKLDELTVLVSPHSDDLAYSIGGAILKRIFLEPMIGVTVFTRSEHFNYGVHGLSSMIANSLPRPIPIIRYFNRNLSTLEITRYRKKEDLRFFRSVSIPRVDLNLSEAPLRGFRNPLSVSNIISQAKNEVSSELHLFMTRLLSNVTKGSLILPLGLGGHIDHRIVRDTCTSLRSDFQKIYYEDLPYAANLVLEDISKIASSFNQRLEPHIHNIQDVFADKIQNLKLYRSQVGEVQLKKIARHAERFTMDGTLSERIWHA